MNSVCVKLDTVTYSSYENGGGLAYYFTNADTGQVLMLNGPSNVANPCFQVPAGTYNLVIKTKPITGLGQSTSQGQDVTVPDCRTLRGTDRPRTNDLLKEATPPEPIAGEVDESGMKKGPFKAHCFCVAGSGNVLDLGQIAEYGGLFPQKEANQEDCKQKCAAALNANGQFTSDAYWCSKLGAGTHTITSQSHVGTVPWRGTSAGRQVVCPAGGAAPALVKLSDNPREAEAQASRMLLELCQRQPQITNLISGVADNFAGGPDPMSPLSPALTAFAAGKPRVSFDQNAVDQFMMSSFRIPACKSCGGVLIVRARRPATDIATSNDGFSIGDATSNFAKNSLYKRVWSDTFPSALEVTFAIALPASMINSIIFQGTGPAYFLDFYLQDDTAVDYVQLLLGQ